MDAVSRALLPYLTLLLLAAFAGFAEASDEATAMVPTVDPSPGAPSPLLALREMDMHLHAGLERTTPLAQWIDAVVKDGRKVFIALDHRELYDKTEQEYDAWAKENGVEKWYPVGDAGKSALMKELADLQKRNDIIAFRGWEIWEGELDEGLDRDAMRLAEVIGWHISPNGDAAPDGRALLHRVRQILEVQKDFPVPMIVFHPFTSGISRVQKDARKAGKSLSSLTTDDYRFFRPGEQEELARLLDGQSVYIEISQGQARYMDDPVIREALIADIKPLANLGVQFTVSTDAHGLDDVTRRFEPEPYCSPLGVTPQNTNGIVRDLLARRAVSGGAGR